MAEAACKLDTDFVFVARSWRTTSTAAPTLDDTPARLQASGESVAADVRLKLGLPIIDDHPDGLVENLESWLCPVHAIRARLDRRPSCRTPCRVFEWVVLIRGALSRNKVGRDGRTHRPWHVRPTSTAFSPSADAEFLAEGLSVGGWTIPSLKWRITIQALARGRGCAWRSAQLRLDLGSGRSAGAPALRVAGSRLPAGSSARTRADGSPRPLHRVLLLLPSEASPPAGSHAGPPGRIDGSSGLR